MKLIYECEKGDEIVRIFPAKPINNICDRSYLGEKLIFVGIANGQIYLKRTDSLHLKLFGNELINLSLDLWDDGWDDWVDPSTLINNKIDLRHIENKLFDALTQEDYELANTLKDIINNNKEKNE